MNIYLERYDICSMLNPSVKRVCFKILIHIACGIAQADNLHFPLIRKHRRIFFEVSRDISVFLRSVTIYRQ